MTFAGRVALGALALILGLGALLAGDPESLAETRISPMELAREIRSGDPRPLILDLRSDEAFQDFHIPTARRMPLPQIEETVVPEERAVVLYGEHPSELREARQRLLAAGMEVRILEGGVAGWLREVLNPVLAEDAEEEQRRAFLEEAEVSRYFGGVPRIVPREELQGEGNSISEMVEDMRLRGCRGG